MAIYRRSAPLVSVNIAGNIESLASASTAPGNSAAAATEPSGWETVAGVAFFIGALAVAVIFLDTNVTFTPPEGIGAFALFFVIAAAIERLLEFAGSPIEWLLSKIRKDRKTNNSG